MTKLQRGFLESHNRSTATELADVYGRPSMAKREAFANCVRLFNIMNGTAFRILSANTFQFTVAWFYVDPDTGAARMHVETAKNTYDFEI